MDSFSSRLGAFVKTYLRYSYGSRSFSFAVSMMLKAVALLRHSSTYRDHSARLLFFLMICMPFDMFHLVRLCTIVAVRIQRSTTAHFVFAYVFAHLTGGGQYGDLFDGYHGVAISLKMINIKH